MANPAPQTAQTDVPMYSIGTVARMLGISVFTLRMYERKGLIVCHRAESRQRLYSESDIERVRCIRRAINEEKLSIAGIRRIFSLIPCWDVVGCDATHRQKCPAFSGHAQPCWTYDHDRNKCASTDCRLCEVYKLSSDCGKIKERIMSMTRER